MVPILEVINEPILPAITTEIKVGANSKITDCRVANPIKYLDANPIFIDSESLSWNMCPELLEKSIVEGIEKNKKPKAIILVHLYGMPAKMDEIMKISNQYDITLIAVAA